MASESGILYARILSRWTILHQIQPMPTQKSKSHNARARVKNTPNEFMAIAFPSIWYRPQLLAPVITKTKTKTKTFILVKRSSLNVTRYSHRGDCLNRCRLYWVELSGHCPVACGEILFSPRRWVFLSAETSVSLRGEEMFPPRRWEKMQRCGLFKLSTHPPARAW